MKPELRKKLLERMFSSPDYIEKFVRHFEAAVDGLYESLDYFERHPPEGVDWESWHISDKPEGWRDRVIPNFERMLNSARQGLEDARRGNYQVIEGLTGSMIGLSRDMEGMGEKWWDHVPLEISRKYGVNLTRAMEMAANIGWTLGGAWNDDEILKENITGPINEEELLKYLEPGEVVE